MPSSFCKSISKFVTLACASLSVAALSLSAYAQETVTSNGTLQSFMSPTDIATMQQQCGNSANADIVIMIDKTGSISTTDLTNEKNAAKTLLGFFSTAVVKPKVAIGTFNVMTDSARIVSGGSLTATYGADGSPGTGLYAALNAISTPTGYTDIGAAISVAQAELSARGSSPAQYIILISDGVTNRPSSPTPDSCSSGTPGTNASNAASAAESLGTKIFTIHFGADGPCLSGTGMNFLMNQIATSAAYYYDGNSNLSGIFANISQAIVCNDGNACTIDYCGTNNICQTQPSSDPACQTPTPTPSPTRSPTPSPTASCSPSPTATKTPTASPTRSPTPSPTASPTPSPSASCSPSPSATKTPTPSPTMSPTPSPTASCSPSPTATQTPTKTPTPSPTASCSPSPTATSTPTPSATKTPTASATPTQSPTASCSPSPSATKTPTPSPTMSPTPSPTASYSPSPTATKTPTASPTKTPTASPTASCSPSPTATRTPTASPTKTPTSSPSASPSSTPSPTTSPTTTPTPPLDCLGVPNGGATFDRCGVCNGDGTSCLKCDNLDITQKLFTLDGTGRSQRQLITRVTKELLKKNKKKAVLVKKVLAQADSLYMRAWSLTWEVPQVITTCENTTFCVKKDHGAVLDDYSSASNALHNLALQTIRELKKARGASKTIQRYTKETNANYSQASATLAQVPRVSQSCTSDT